MHGSQPAHSCDRAPWARTVVTQCEQGYLSISRHIVDWGLGMTPEPKRGDALQLIFSIFVGVLIVVVVGVGVWTFYPPPFGENSPKQQQLQELFRKQQEVDASSPLKTGGQLSPADQAKSQRIQKQINDLQRAIEVERKPWAVNTSIIVLTIATILMAISLFLPEVAKVFSNGILLGGLFSVLYGTGVSFSGGDSRARFYVTLTALVMSLGVGYLRFIRGKHEKAAEKAGRAGTSAGDAAVDDVALADLAGRVQRLEQRAAAAAAALGSDQER